MPETLQKTVIVIPPTILEKGKKEKKGQLRVAAYCRVSTDDEEQLTSYKNQIEYYTKMIEDNPEWKLISIFADEGISGTMAKRRPEFNRMISMCRKQRLDLIITKSVSRFARNTVDCLKYVRLLKELNIAVYFQKENINTMEMNSELMLAFYGGFAQSESESISANVAWGKRKSFQDGKVIFQYKKLYAYCEGADGEPEIIPEEAEVVRRIYRSFLAGYSVQRIKADLEQENIPAPGKHGVWSRTTLLNILQNEKYAGDAILQKTFTSDCISKKVKKNNGELPMYYVQNNHTAIIPRELYNLVQQEFAQRNSAPKNTIKPTKTNKGKFSSKFALTGIVLCGECSTPYRRVTWTARGQRRIVWRCISRLESGTEICKQSPTIPEEHLHAMIMQAIRALAGECGDVLPTLKNCIQSVFSAGDDSAESLEAQISTINADMIHLMEMSLEANAEEGYFDEKFIQMANEVKALRERMEQVRQVESNSVQDQLLNALGDMLEESVDLCQYHDALVRQLVEQVEVLAVDRMKVRFKNGKDFMACLSLSA